MDSASEEKNKCCNVFLFVLGGGELGEEEVLIHAAFWTGIELIGVCLPEHGHSRIVRVVRNWNSLPRSCLPRGRLNGGGLE